MRSKESVLLKLKLYQRKYNKQYPSTAEIKLSTFESNIAVSKDELDTMIERQSVIYQDISEKVALATSIRDAVKDNLDSLEGELSDKHRDLLSRKGSSGVRITDKQVGENVRNDPLFIKDSLAYNVAKNMALRWMSLRSSFEMRASMLKLLANLFVSNYYTSSSVSGEGSSQREVVGRKSRDRITRSRKLKRD